MRPVSVAALVTAGAAAMLIAGCVSAKPIRVFDEHEPIRHAGPTRTLLVKRVVSTIEKGADVGTVQAGLACGGQRRFLWARGGQLDPGVETNYADRVREELSRAGYSVVGGVGNLSGRALFEDAAQSQADFLLAAVIKSVAWNFCYPYAGFGGTSSTGEAAMEVEWQLYDTEARHVVLTLTTGGTARTMEAKDRGGLEAGFNAFGMAVRNLLADPQFAFYLRPRPSSK